MRENQYDNADNLILTKDRNNRQREFAYTFAFGADGNYRLDQESWQLAGVYSNRIKSAYTEGNGLWLTSITDQNAPSPTAVYSKVEFSYDDLGRLALLRDRIDPTTSPQSSESFDLNYTYNTVDQRTNAVGRFRQFNGSGVATAFQWDASMTYGWDKLNRVTSVQQVTAINPANTTWAVDHTKTKTVALQYYAHGALKKLTRTQGSSTSASTTLVTDYQQQNPEWWYAGEVAAIVHSGFDGGAAQNRSIEYDFDVARRVTDTREKLGTTTIDARIYAYDTTSQVTGVTSTAGAAEAYNYDTNGNRTTASAGSSSATYATSAFNRVTDDGTYTYQYDNEGNRTRRENKVRPPTTDTTTVWFETYTWDFRNRLTGVTKYNRNGTWLEFVTYEYDGLDQKIRKTVTIPGQSNPTVQERYVYDRNVLDPSMSDVLLVINELSSASLTYQKVTHRFMNGPQIDQVFSDETNGGILWYLQDRQNTVRDVATWDGHGDATKEWKDVNHISYDTFGNVIGYDDPTTAGADTNGNPGTDTLNAPRRSYTGREPDQHTGLIYYRARWYDAKLGRFISEDPIGFAAGDANLSRMVGNSTPNGVDPSGMTEPAAWRGQWNSGNVQNGVFEFNSRPENGAWAGQSVRYESGHVARGGFPSAAYATGSAASSTVALTDIGQGYRDRAIAQMIAEGKVPKDFDFTNYRAHHAGPPGSMDIEFVHKDYHGKLNHVGTGKAVRAVGPKGLTSDTCPAVSKSNPKIKDLGKSVKIRGLFIIDVVDTTRTIYEFTGAGGGSVLTEAMQFTDEQGNTFVVGKPLWRDPRKRYTSGPRAEDTESISAAEIAELKTVRDDLYGKVEWVSTGWFSGHWKFIAGARSPNTLPIYGKIQPWDPDYNYYYYSDTLPKIGYVDETGEHYYRKDKRPLCDAPWDAPWGA